jgi:hypothetical protein
MPTYPLTTTIPTNVESIATTSSLPKFEEDKAIGIYTPYVPMQVTPLFPAKKAGSPFRFTNLKLIPVFSARKAFRYAQG